MNRNIFTNPMTLRPNLKVKSGSFFIGGKKEKVPSLRRWGIFLADRTTEAWLFHKIKLSQDDILVPFKGKTPKMKTSHLQNQHENNPVPQKKALELSTGSFGDNGDRNVCGGSRKLSGEIIWSHFLYLFAQSALSPRISKFFVLQSKFLHYIEKVYYRKYHDPSLGRLYFW